MSKLPLVGWASLLLFAAIQTAAAQNISVQQPNFGVAVDADGVLSVVTKTDPTGQLHAARLAQARANVPADLGAASNLRKISLVRLERAVREALLAGNEPDEAMKHLAGLQRVQYVFCYPDARDIVIAGTAEGWVDDGLGRPVGVTSGNPVILLEDLIVALRAFDPQQQPTPQIGCSIDPVQEGLARYQAYVQTMPRRVPVDQRIQAAEQIVEGTRDALGFARVRVTGISPQTHFARVLIEADYRMKLIAVGLEPPPIKMSTYVDMVKGAASQSALQQWWFTPNYDCVRATDDRLAAELVGPGVQLQCETHILAANGAIQPRHSKPDRASELYAQAFTRKYPQIAAASPVYAQMRNLIDLSIASAYLRKHDFYARAAWSLGIFADEAALPVEDQRTPELAPCVVNCIWKGNRLLVPAGGGVTINPAEALLPDRIQRDDRGTLAQQYDALKAMPVDRWWWD